MDDKPKPKSDAPRLLIPEEAIPFQTTVAGMPVWDRGTSGLQTMANLKAVVRKLEAAGILQPLPKRSQR